MNKVTIGILWRGGLVLIGLIIGNLCFGQDVHLILESQPGAPHVSLIESGCSGLLVTDTIPRSTTSIDRLKVATGDFPWFEGGTRDGSTIMDFSSSSTSIITSQLTWDDNPLSFKVNTKWGRQGVILDISEVYPRTLYTSTQIIEVVIPRGHEIIVRVDGGGEEPFRVVFPLKPKKAP